MIGLPATNDRQLALRGNRSAIARRKRQLVRRGMITSVIGQARDFAESLRDGSPDQLRQHTDRLRQLVATGDPHDNHRLWAMAAAGVIEAIRQTLGMNLFDVQLHAGIVVACGAVAEMQTGEGKTLSAALPAYFQALPGRGVHVATPNDYLASRDHEILSPVFRRLGMTTGLLSTDAKPDQTRHAYQADITYGPGHAFGFDYLRDQLTLANRPKEQLPTKTPSIGASILQRAAGDSPESRLLQRGLHASIIDEVDHVLLDDAVSPLLLSGSGDEEAGDAEVHCAALDFAECLTEKVDYTSDGTRSGVRLTDAGFDRVYRDDAMALHRCLIRPWHEYVLLALRAEFFFKRDVHYVVRDNKVQIIDASTGRIFQDRTWSEGLHQAIQAAEGLKITAETEALARITRQRFYRYYESIGGMTGTATGCESEFASVYGLPVVVIPLRNRSKRQMLPEHLSVSQYEKILAIADETEAMHLAGRAVLIGTLNVAESIEVADELSHRRLDFQLLNGVQDADEASIVARAGHPGAITVATNLAGRGTDIALDQQVAQAGGLHVIVTQKHSLARVDRQLIGRCARCGDPGTARVYISADDNLPRLHAPWLERAIRRRKEQGGLELPGLIDRLSKVQRGLQRQEAARRWSMLQTDQETEKLLTKKMASPRGCWQL